MPVSSATNLVLASGSPRRQDLLREMGLSFQVKPAQTDGPPTSEEPGERVLGHALHKASEIAAVEPTAVILAADTLVWCRGHFLPKPVDRADAARMLHRLSGVEHQVWTGACLIKGGQVLAQRADCACVQFDILLDSEIEAYLKTTEWCDKAGAYGIQGWAASRTKLLTGWHGTVVGLASEAVSALFLEAGLSHGGETGTMLGQIRR
ncbi:MAG: septum formation protein Maf [Planctomycetes bacterium]|nr:septum formation protein Maf [Planctomycetota bacterium]MBT4028499.1 septum formation protein Maf [Planctomycetota bacterium]MBT4559391.1 septum formation protein Maf [Planctomycetota bacterium]MBT5102068.1 septum formation protein Maf [Planctomycetota bacterium]MBT5120815.1 septum formation protein Maf [Planctomycetota bacterium]